MSTILKFVLIGAGIAAFIWLLLPILMTQLMRVVSFFDARRVQKEALRKKQEAEGSVQSEGTTSQQVTKSVDVVDPQLPWEPKDGKGSAKTLSSFGRLQPRIDALIGKFSTRTWVIIGVVAIIMAACLPPQSVIGPLMLLTTSFLFSRMIWRRITWPMIARILGDQGVFWVRNPQERWIAIDKDRSITKSQLSTGQQRREEFRLWCFMKNLMQIARMQSESAVYICGKLRHDYRNLDPDKKKDDPERIEIPNVVLLCRELLEQFERGEVTVDELDQKPELKWLNKEYPPEAFKLKYHRALRKTMFEHDSRTYFMLPEGVGGLWPIPPFWIVDVKVVEELPVTDEERAQIAIREAKVKHSVDLRQRVYYFPKENEDPKKTGIENAIVAREMRIPNQTTGDLVEVGIALSGNILPVDPEKIAYKVTNALYASYLLLLGPLGHAVRSLLIKEMILSSAIADHQISEILDGKPKATEKDFMKSAERGVSQFLTRLKPKYGIELGQIRPFPRGWADRLENPKAQAERALRLFPDALIPTREFLPAKDQQLSEPDRTLFTALGFTKRQPYLNSNDHVHWKNGYLSHESTIGTIEDRMGYFSLFDLADVEIANGEVTKQLLEQWLYKTFDARGRMISAEATKREQLLDLAGRAEGIDAQLAKLSKHEIVGTDAVELIKYFERNRMLAGLPKNQNLNMFLGEDGTKPLGSEKEQLLFSLLANANPSLFSKLLKLRDTAAEPTKPESSEASEKAPSASEKP